MLMHTPALPSPVTPAERDAALWAVTVAHVLLRHGEAQQDPAADDLRHSVPGLLDSIAALKDGQLDA